MNRPTHWYGVDAPEGGIEIDWQLIEMAAADLNAGADHKGAIALYNWFSALATGAYVDGDLEVCGALASYGMAALNYWTHQ